jgi:pimeloyl-ACP methyl ester carboxylesterase
MTGAAMLLKLAKTVSYTLLGLILSIVAAAAIGSYFSLDRNFTHSKASAELPTIDSAPSNGLIQLAANDFSFRARVAGFDNIDGELVILLHGFPVTSAMWEPLLPALAKAGYRAIAFDQRGYSPGARPLESSAYTIDHLVSDVMAVADALGAEQFHLVGHDWGSAVGWNTVLSHPSRILSWTGLSIAHPAAFADALQNDPDQQSRSAYFALFTTPLVPEILLTFNGLALLSAAYEGMDQAKSDEYQAVFSEPRALTSALNWYRQMNASRATAQTADMSVTAPTLFIWGNNDAAVGRGAVEAQRQYMRGDYRVIELDGEHWLMTSHASQIVPEILEHFRSASEQAIN